MLSHDLTVGWWLPGPVITAVYSKEHAGGNWYDVPYKIMVPKRGQGANLLVPVALSASAVAFSSTRIENMYHPPRHQYPDRNP